MAKVGPGDAGQVVGAGNVINFKSVIYNESIGYCNGIFLIFHPGYYEVTITLLNGWDWNLAAFLSVNNERGSMYGQVGGKYQTLSISTIVKLDLYDTVSFGIANGKIEGWNEGNHFAIRKINANEVYY